MSKPQFIKIYRCVWNNEDIKKLKDSSFRFLIYILFKSYQQSNKNLFKLKPKEIYTDFNTSHTKLWRIQKDLTILKIKIGYTHKQYSFDLTDFFKNYYPNCFKNETVNDINCN